MEYILRHTYERFKTFDPLIIIEELGINIEYVPFLENPKGLYIKVHDTPCILINDKIEETNERYFVAAHELYHAMYHEDLIGYYSISTKSKRSMETEANKFATNLLIELFIEEHQSLPYSIQEMNYKYGVPLDYGYLIKE